MDYNFHKKEFFLSYYIGSDWIDREKGRSILVTPKIKGIDFQKMFMACFYDNSVNDNLDELFHIRTNDSLIDVPSNEFQLEPLLIIYYINLVKQIVRKGLRKDYVIREERLKSKIKGKMMFSQYIKHGIAKNRKETVPCRFEEYSIDCTDNRILKKALLICKDMIVRNKKVLSTNYTILNNIMNEVMAAFEHISADISVKDLARVRINKVFKLYKSAIPLAKMIIRKKGYCVTKSNHKGMVSFPPFIINMPLLFERYVYGLLVEKYGKYNIGFQERVKGGIMDFSKKDEHMVIDTKYITTWDKDIIHDNVGQLSRYARNISNRYKYLEIDDDRFICPCMIIYPSIDGADDLKSAPDILASEDIHAQYPYIKPIHEYLKFFKLSIKLPVIQ